MKYRKKAARSYQGGPVEVEALQWGTEIPLGNFPGWVRIALAVGEDRAGRLVSNGDWIIQGVLGEIYACKPDIFALTYEIANPVTAPPLSSGNDMPGPEVQ